MKKFSWILALLAALAVVFVGVGCGGGGDPEEKGLATDVTIKGIVDSSWVTDKKGTTNMQLQGFNKGDAIESPIATDGKWELEALKGEEVSLPSWATANTSLPWIGMDTTATDGEGGDFDFTITSITFGEKTIQEVLEATSWADVLTKGAVYFKIYGTGTELSGTTDGIVVTRPKSGKYRNNESIAIDFVKLAKLASGGEVEAPGPYDNLKKVALVRDNSGTAVLNYWVNTTPDDATAVLSLADQTVKLTGLVNDYDGLNVQAGNDVFKGGIKVGDKCVVIGKGTAGKTVRLHDGAAALTDDVTIPASGEFEIVFTAAAANVTTIGALLEAAAEEEGSVYTARSAVVFRVAPGGTNGVTEFTITAFLYGTP